MYNEEKVAKKTIDSIVDVIRNIKAAKILVIDDGSVDQTPSILKKTWKKSKSLLIITHKKNKGYGAAVQTGINFAIKKGFDYCLHMDSDFTNNPKDILSFTKTIPLGYDCVKASRYIYGSKTIGVPFYRQAFSVIGNIIASFLFKVGLKDCTNGFRMVKLEKLKGIKFKENNFSIILEELYYLKKRKATFKEIPYTLTVRRDSKSHFIYKPKTFYDYFKYALKSFLLP